MKCLYIDTFFNVKSIRDCSFIPNKMVLECTIAYPAGCFLASAALRTVQDHPRFFYPIPYLSGL